MVSWWGIYSYFNHDQIQTRDVVLMNAAYGSSGSFGAIVRQKCIRTNTYTGRESNFHSKPKPIHKLFHKYDLNFYYSRSHFSRLL